MVVFGLQFLGHFQVAFKRGQSLGGVGDTPLPEC